MTATATPTTAPPVEAKPQPMPGDVLGHLAEDMGDANLNFRINTDRLLVNPTPERREFRCQIDREIVTLAQPSVSTVWDVPAEVDASDRWRASLDSPLRKPVSDEGVGARLETLDLEWVATIAEPIIGAPAWIDGQPVRSEARTLILFSPTEPQPGKYNLGRQEIVTITKVERIPRMVPNDARKHLERQYFNVHVLGRGDSPTDSQAKHAAGAAIRWAPDHPMVLESRDGVEVSISNAGEVDSLRSVGTLQVRVTKSDINAGLLCRLYVLFKAIPSSLVLSPIVADSKTGRSLAVAALSTSVPTAKGFDIFAGAPLPTGEFELRWMASIVPPPTWTLNATIPLPGASSADAFKR